VIGKIKKVIKNPRLLLNKLNYRWGLKSKKLPDLVFQMAKTGERTDECLAKGALPMLVHFYSPVPDVADLQTRKVFAKKSKLNGIDFREKEQLEFLLELGKNFGEECDWPINPTGIEEEFYLNNFCFSYGCAAGLHSMIRNFKPKNIIEIGSGFSSRVISKALTLNQKQGRNCNYTIIDPYPNEVIEKKLKNVTTLTKERVELVSPEVFNSLQENDILFIDSGHTVRIGGDVNFLFLDVLPILAKGVIIHIHDINLPYEYPEAYCTNPSFRVFWTEAYLLQAFLAFNTSFEVLLGMSYIQTEHMDIFKKAFPKYTTDFSGSGSFWIRKVK
jgi:hypothetical protein